MNQLEQKKDEAIYMCVADNDKCQAPRIFSKEEDKLQHQSHKRDYFDINKTIGKISDSKQNLIKFKQDEWTALGKLKEEVDKKEKDIKELNEKIGNTDSLIKNLQSQNSIFIKQNLQLLNKIRFDQYDLDQSQLHQTRQLLTTLSLDNTLIESSQLYEYPDFKAKFKELQLDKFMNCNVNCSEHQQNKIDSLFLDQYLQTVLRAACISCQGQTRMSIKKCKELLEQVIEQENNLENIIALAKDAKKFRNKILKTLKHLITTLDLEIKRAQQNILSRQRNFRNIQPENNGEFRLKNYQWIGEMLSQNITNSGSKPEIKSDFSELGNHKKIINITEFMKEMREKFLTFTEQAEFQRFFNEQEEKIRLTVEIVRKKNDFNEVKGYEMKVKKNQEISVLLNWIKTKEGLDIDKVVQVQHNFENFQFDLDTKWQNTKIQNGAIIHVIFE